MRFINSLIVLALASLACMASPLSVSEVNIPPGKVLFQDDFSDPSSGWDRLQDAPEGTLDYVDGEYRIFVNRNNLMLSSNPGLSFTDVRIQVNATKIAGPDDDDFGIVCRSKDKNNFYFLIISSDGYFGIGKVQDGSQELIGINEMPPSESIIQGRATNHLRADCVGNNLSLYVNGIQLATVKDSDFSSGDVGLVAGTFVIPGNNVHFDNFTVLKP